MVIILIKKATFKEAKHECYTQDLLGLYFLPYECTHSSNVPFEGTLRTPISAHMISHNSRKAKSFIYMPRTEKMVEIFQNLKKTAKIIE